MGESAVLSHKCCTQHHLHCRCWRLKKLQARHWEHNTNLEKPRCRAVDAPKHIGTSTKFDHSANHLLLTIPPACQMQNVNQSNSHIGVYSPHDHVTAIAHTTAISRIKQPASSWCLMQQETTAVAAPYQLHRFQSAKVKTNLLYPSQATRAWADVLP